MSALIRRCVYLLLLLWLLLDVINAVKTLKSSDDFIVDPDIFEVAKSIEEAPTNYTGIINTSYSAEFERHIKMNEAEMELSLSWQEAFPLTGERVDRFVRYREHLNVSDEESKEMYGVILPSHKRTREDERRREKRRIFGSDTRTLVPLRRFGHRFPFTSVVKLSTGCTGTLVSPKHVLTSAHCIHDQTDYVTGYKTLKVGLIPNLRLSKRFRWIRVNQTFLPNGWLMGNPNVASRFDYALLKLEKSHAKPYFELDVSVGATRAAIHFTAFEDDKPRNTLWYRNCRVTITDTHVLYHYCDAKPGSSGAGVYTFTKLRGEWKRRLIAVFSGHRFKKINSWWRPVSVSFNAAIRMNTNIYRQICGWMGTYAAKSCKRYRRNMHSG